MASITMDLPDDAAHALAQMAKRFRLDHAQALSSKFERYSDGRLEFEHMVDAVEALRVALADAGFGPR